jgi:hypothetical protein
MPPLALAAGVAAVGTIGGALIGAHAQSKASSQAAQTQNDATQAQLELGRESLGLNQAIYNSNYDVLSPYASRGNVAGDSINALLGLPAAPAMHSPLASSPTPTPAAAAPNTQFPLNPAATLPAGGIMTPSGAPITAQTFGTQGYGPTALQNALASGGLNTGDMAVGSMGRVAATRANAMNVSAGAPTSTVGAQGAPAPAPTAATPTAQAPAVTAPSATQAFDNFANSAGMQFQLQQGANALNNLYAARGMVQSGAAMKGIQNYGQQTALNNYFLPYMGLLGNQQAVGAGAASSIAGVGANFGNTAAGINSNMGNSIQGGADAASNAALLRGQANANMWNSVGGALGTLAGSSFGPGGVFGSGGGITVNNTLPPGFQFKY